MRANALLTTVLGIVVVLCCGAGSWLTRSVKPEPQPTDLTVETKSLSESSATAVAIPAAAGTATTTGLPQPVAAKTPDEYRAGPDCPPNTWTGIYCPDGKFLPLLNGVPYAYPMRRFAEDGPLPPVVGIIEDAGGYQWYKHADGSVTTTRWTPMTHNGKSITEVVTSHNVPVDDDMGRTAGNTVTKPAPPTSKSN